MTIIQSIAMETTDLFTVLRYAPLTLMVLFVMRLLWAQVREVRKS